jgi:hypothetical protein
MADQAGRVTHVGTVSCLSAEGLPGPLGLVSLEPLRHATKVERSDLPASRPKGSMLRNLAPSSPVVFSESALRPGSTDGRIGKEAT